MNSTVGNNMSKLHSSTALDLLFQNLNDLICYQHLCVPPTVLTEKVSMLNMATKNWIEFFSFSHVYSSISKYNGFWDAGT